MSTAERVVDVLIAMHKEGRQAYARRYGSEALGLADELVKALEPHLTVYGPLWGQFTMQPQLMGAALAPIIQTLLNTNAELHQRVSELLMRLKALSSGGTTVNTGGGAYIGGNVTVQGGDVVGRDKTVIITGDGNVVGNGNVVTVTKTTGVDLEKLRAFFDSLQKDVAARPDLPPVTKEDVHAELKDVETELKKDEQADENVLMRHLRNIGRMAPDILDVMLTTFANPVAGLGKVAQKIAEKARAEAEKQG